MPLGYCILKCAFLKRRTLWGTTRNYHQKGHVCSREFSQGRGSAASALLALLAEQNSQYSIPLDFLVNDEDSAVSFTKGNYCGTSACRTTSTSKMFRLYGCDSAVQLCNCARTSHMPLQTLSVCNFQEMLFWIEQRTIQPVHCLCCKPHGIILMEKTQPEAKEIIP